MARALELGGAPVTLLCYDAGLVVPELHGAGEILAVGEAVPEGVQPTRRIRFRDYLRRGAAPELEAEQVVVVGVGNAGLAGVLAAIRHGGRVFHFVHQPGDCLTFGAAWALRIGAARSVRRRLVRVPGAEGLAERALGLRLDPPWATLRSSLGAVDRAIRFAGRKAPALPEGSLRVVHYVGGLGPGGAERQLTYLAAAQRRAGHDVEVWTATPLTGERAHYRATLEAAGVPVSAIDLHRRHRALPTELESLPPDLLDAIDRHRGAELIVPLLVRLLASPPTVLHCWLNEQNVFGAVAGLAARVSRVVLSTRNVSPRHLPRLDRPDYQGSYRALGACKRVRIVANSSAGAQDYAAWAELAPDRFQVVLNGFSVAGVAPASASERAAERERLGVPADAFLVVGVFRLDVEKRPLDFLRVLARLRERVPGLAALHVGVGLLTAEVQAEARRLGLSEVVRFLGRLDDPLAVVRTADATLLCSEAEGCPNVSLESQAVGVPVVLTDSGGSAETVRAGETGFVRGIGDLEGLAADLARLAEDPPLRERLGSGGPAWIAERFGLDRMVAETLAAYR